MAESSTPGPKPSPVGPDTEAEDGVPDTEPRLGSTSIKRSLMGSDHDIAETPQTGNASKRARSTPPSTIKGPCFICGEPVTDTDGRIKRESNEGYAHLACAEEDSRVYRRVSSQMKSSSIDATAVPSSEDEVAEDGATFVLRLKRTWPRASPDRKSVV